MPQTFKIVEAFILITFKEKHLFLIKLSFTMKFQNFHELGQKICMFF